MLYKLFFYMMLLGYAGLTIQAPDLRGKIVGGLLLLANAGIFYR